MSAATTTPTPPDAPAEAPQTPRAPVDPNARPYQPPPPPERLAPPHTMTDGPEGTSMLEYRIPPSGDRVADSQTVWRAAEDDGYTVVGAPSWMGDLKDATVWQVQVAAVAKKGG
jgi:hypothetical protein